MSRGRMEWTAQTAPRDSEIINELIARRTQGFNSPNSPLRLRNHQGTDVMGDAWIGHPKQPQGLRNHQGTDVTGTHGLDTPNYP